MDQSVYYEVEVLWFASDLLRCLFLPQGGQQYQLDIEHIIVSSAATQGVSSTSTHMWQTTVKTLGMELTVVLEKVSNSGIQYQRNFQSMNPGAHILSWPCVPRVCGSWFHPFEPLYVMW